MNAHDHVDEVLREEEAREQRGLAAQRERDIHEADCHRVLSVEWGRRFVARLLSKEPDSVFNTNALVMARLSGRQDVARELRAELRRIDPDGLQRMENEAAAPASRNRSANG